MVNCTKHWTEHAVAQCEACGQHWCAVCQAVGEITSEMGEDASAAAYCEAVRRRLFED